MRRTGSLANRKAARHGGNKVLDELGEGPGEGLGEGLEEEQTSTRGASPSSMFLLLATVGIVC